MNAENAAISSGSFSALASISSQDNAVEETLAGVSSHLDPAINASPRIETTLELNLNTNYDADTNTIFDDDHSQHKNESQPATTARFEQRPLNLKSRYVSDSTTVGDSRHTYTAMSRSHAPTSLDEVQSTYSYDSTRDFSAYFQEINGRRFTSAGATYMLPFGE
jgi:hypothetical protein